MVEPIPNRLHHLFFQKMVTTRVLFSMGMLEVSGIEILPINNGATIISLMPATSPNKTAVIPSSMVLMTNTCSRIPLNT